MASNTGMKTAEFLIPPDLSMTGGPMMEALFKAASLQTRTVRTVRYQGDCDLLVLYGVGHPARDLARQEHIRSGRRVIMWDMGYFRRLRPKGFCRVSIDTDHPQAWLDGTPGKPSRWLAQEIALRDVANPTGHIILVGLGYKSRVYLNTPNWEVSKLRDLRKRFPGHKIVFRPKPSRATTKRPEPKIDLPVETGQPIEQLLEGASLVVCRHSNVAVDAAIAGVPFECEEGAAMWLQAREFSLSNRLTFLQKLAWWQWEKLEARVAWKFITDQLERIET